MSKKDWEKEDIENTLTKFPKIEDTRSKDELFQAIQKRHKETTPSRMKQQRQKQWFFPAMASAAAVLLIILMIPSFMNSGMFTASDNNSAVNSTAMTGNNNNAEVMENSETAEESNGGTEPASNNAGNTAVENNAADQNTASNEDSAVNNNEEENEERNQENNNADASPADNGNSENQEQESAENNENEAMNESEDNDVNQEIETAEIEYAYEEEESTFVTASVTESDGEEIVALSPVETEGVSREEAALTALQESITTSAGIFEKLEEVVFNSPEEGAVSLLFAEDTMLESMGSTEQLYAQEMIQEILSIHQVTEVHFYAGDEEASFGQSGESVLELSLMNRGYYLTETEELVSARTVGAPMTNGAGDALTFDETLDVMSETAPDAFYESAIPEEIEVEDVRYEEETAFIFYNYSGDDEEELNRFQEAVQLTAKYFTLDTLQFVDEESEEVTIVPVQVQ